MMKSAETAPALLVIGSLLLQAAARGDIAAVREHMTVYEAVVKSARREAEQRAGE